VTAVELLHVGDVIKEINGNEVTTPEQLQDIMRKSSGTVTFKIIPTMQEQNASAQVKSVSSEINYCHIHRPINEYRGVCVCVRACVCVCDDIETDLNGVVPGGIAAETKLFTIRLCFYCIRRITNGLTGKGDSDARILTYVQKFASIQGFGHSFLPIKVMELQGRCHCSDPKEVSNDAVL
jgi:hypothetical protein